MRRRGFTVLEILVAMVLATAVLLPSSLWLYKKRVNQAAYRSLLVQDSVAAMLRADLDSNDSRTRSWGVQAPVAGKWEVSVENDGMMDVHTVRFVFPDGRVVGLIGFRLGEVP